MKLRFMMRGVAVGPKRPILRCNEMSAFGPIATVVHCGGVFGSNDRPRAKVANYLPVVLGHSVIDRRA
jgi:hypothetical protein